MALCSCFATPLLTACYASDHPHRMPCPSLLSILRIDELLCDESKTFDKAPHVFASALAFLLDDSHLAPEPCEPKVQRKLHSQQVSRGYIFIMYATCVNAWWDMSRFIITSATLYASYLPLVLQPQLSGDNIMLPPTRRRAMASPTAATAATAAVAEGQKIVTAGTLTVLRCSARQQKSLVPVLEWMLKC